MAKILIVDDRPANRDYLVTLLGYGGHQLLEAADGSEALEAVRRELPDLVIADVLMPTMDGYEFVRQLRADPAIDATPVVFCTAHYHEVEAKALARACGVAGVLTKPCEPEEVIRTVATVLAGAVPAPAAIPDTEAFDREHLRLLTDKLSDQANELRRANERLTAFIDLSLQLGSERELARLLDCFVHDARGILGASAAIVGILNGDRSALRYCLTSGLDAAAVSRLGAPVLDLLAFGFNGQRTRRDRNPGGDPSTAGFTDRFPPVHSWLVAAIRSPTRTYGWLLLLDKFGAEEFRDDDERLADILAAQLGRVYENGSLYNEVLRQAEELTRKVEERGRAEQRFRALIESAPDALVIVDGAGAIVIANERTEKLFGYTRAELLGQSVDLLIPDRYRDNARAFRQTFLSDPQLSPLGEAMELAGRRKDGAEFPVEINLSPLQTDEGVVVTIAIRNITSRKQSQEALRASEESLREIRNRLEHMLDANPAVIFSSLVEDQRIRRIAWISDNVRHLLGYEPSEALTATWWFGNIHPEDVDRVRSTMHRSLSADGKAGDEFRFKHKDGEYRWIRSEMRLLRDPAGVPIEIVGSWSDITERKQLEDQILHAQKMEAIGKLAGGIAHDFNNLLTVINGYCELLLAGTSPKNGNREPLQEIHNAGDRAAALTRQLLAFSRKAVLTPVVVDLNALINNLHKMLARLIGEDIELKLVLQATGKVKVDPGQMEQTIVNLAVNARDAMPRGGKLLIETADVTLDGAYARRRPETPPGNYVRIAVSDTGVGMDAATQARIFEPFFTTKGPDKGTGLGLSVVHGIVRQSGGRIEVYSERGIGTTFKIYLPRTADEAPASRLMTRTSPRRGTETVLLVEDEAGVRSLTRALLERQGYTVLEARDGEDAIGVSDRFAGVIHIMVTDAVMPRLGGWQLAQRLARSRPDMKVLFLSGYTDDAIVHHGLIGPDVPFLQKPFTAEALANKVRDVLES